MHSICIQVFAKAPVEGYCKTRLARDIGDSRAVHFQREMIAKTMGTVAAVPFCDIQLWCKPATDHPFFVKLAESFDILLLQQSGDNLGQIMLNALKQAIETGYQKIIQIGVDCPVMDTNYLQNAIFLLDDNAFVIGPAQDGGYVLLGATRFEPLIFNDIRWGSPDVLEALLANLANCNQGYKLTKVLYDIDNYSDYSRYLSNTTII